MLILPALGHWGSRVIATPHPAYFPIMVLGYCVYLCFVLLSELEHFGLLSQYYQPLGSWSALKDFHRKGIQLRARHTISTKICWKNQKVKVITSMCCISPRDIKRMHPNAMPHLGSNTKKILVIGCFAIYFYRIPRPARPFDEDLKGLEKGISVP